MQIQKQIEEELPRLRAEIAGAVARGCCYVENSKKVLDPDLLKAMGKELEMLFKKELSTIATKSAEESYKKALDDMFLEICKLAEPDERQPSAGDLNTHLDNIHDIGVKLSKPKE